MQLNVLYEKWIELETDRNGKRVTMAIAKNSSHNQLEIWNMAQYTSWIRNTVYCFVLFYRKVKCTPAQFSMPLSNIFTSQAKLAPIPQPGPLHQSQDQFFPLYYKKEKKKYIYMSQPPVTPTMTGEKNQTRERKRREVGEMVTNSSTALATINAVCLEDKQWSDIELLHQMDACTPSNNFHTKLSK